MTIWNCGWSQFWGMAASLSWCEILMLVCFGASWPSPIRKGIVTKS
ncbi:MAG: hypothetical protein Q4G68_05410 [Planctomycetia bacterium]|nr:hypothetical protein [Planctomycetia bacterium]